jgi:putative ABC transport system substrate-binding protein
MKRRTLLGAFTAGLAAAAMPALAQAPKIRRIGFLAVAPRPTAASPNSSYAAFLSGIQELGYRQGQNLSIEWRYADSSIERLPALAQELVLLKPEVLVTHGTIAAQVLQRTTKTLPIVVASMGDPVRDGLAASLSRPGGNVTGLNTMSEGVAPKQLEFLKQAMPGLSSVAVIVNRANASHVPILKELAGPARSLSIRITEAHIGSPAEVEAAVLALAKQKVQAVILLPDSMLAAESGRIAKLATSLGIASSAPHFSQAFGFLMNYGPVVAEYFRAAATYVDKILKGAKPGDLPIEGATLVPLHLNRKVAAAIGVVLPRELLLRADRVIE